MSGTWRLVATCSARMFCDRLVRLSLFHLSSFLIPAPLPASIPASFLLPLSVLWMKLPIHQGYSVEQRGNTHTQAHMHTYTHTHTYIYTHTHSHTYTFTHIHTYMYTHTHSHTHTYIYTHTYVHTHTPVSPSPTSCFLPQLCMTLMSGVSKCFRGQR